MIRSILKSRQNLILTVLICILFAFVARKEPQAEEGRPASSEELKKMLEAFQKKELSSIKEILNTGVDLNSVRLEDRHTLLARSVSMCDRDMVQFLLENGAKTDLGNYGSKVLNSYFHCGENILHLLAAYGAKIDEDSQDILFHNSDYETLDFLILMGAEIRREDYAGRNLLSEAAEYGRIKTVRFFLRYGISSSAKDKSGKSALDYAFLNNWYDVAEEIIQYDFDEKYFAKMKLLNFYKDDSATYGIPSLNSPLEITENHTKESDLERKKWGYSKYSYRDPVVKKIADREFKYDRIYHTEYETGGEIDKKITKQTVFFLNSAAKYTYTHSYYWKDIKCEVQKCGFHRCDIPESWAGYNEDIKEYNRQKLKAFDETGSL